MPRSVKQARAKACWLWVETKSGDPMPLVGGGRLAAGGPVKGWRRVCYVPASRRSTRGRAK